MSTELMEALTILEQEKDISKETMLDAIEVFPAATSCSAS